jgi:chaperone required for assembly of F1-ATPase
MSDAGSDGSGARKGPNVRPEPLSRPLARRFYVAVAVVERDGRWSVELDGRPVRTPGRQFLAVATQALAEALAEEWRGQGSHIDPGSMPLTRLANTAIDGVTGREVEVANDVAKYAGSDLLCYRAGRPEGLVARQSRLWDPPLAWMEGQLGVRFKRQVGLMPVEQNAAVGEAVARMAGDLDAFRLAAVHVMTTLLGSAVLALAVLRDQLTAEAAWTAAHVDEDWQVAEWGEDAEATLRRQKRWREMAAAAELLRLLEPA